MSYEQYVNKYKELYPEIFSGKYVFGTSNNMIQVMSIPKDAITDEMQNINLPYFQADKLQFHYRFDKFNPEIKAYDFNWQSKNIKKIDGIIYLYNNYATYYKDLEQTFYFDIINANPNYTGIKKIWNRNKEKLRAVFTFENGNPIKFISGDEYYGDNSEISDDKIIINDKDFIII